MPTTKASPSLFTDGSDDLAPKYLSSKLSNAAAADAAELADAVALLAELVACVPAVDAELADAVALLALAVAEFALAVAEFAELVADVAPSLALVVAVDALVLASDALVVAVDALVEAPDALLAEAVAGQAERFDLFKEISHLPFPGGTLLKTPALMLAMTWYRLRDML